MKGRLLSTLATGFILISLIFSPLLLECAYAANNNEYVNEYEDNKMYEASDYFTLVDEEDEDNVILKTGRFLNTGNKFLTQDNKLYKVSVVEEEKNFAKASLIEEIKLDEYIEQGDKIRTLALQGENANSRNIGIYHSHGAESYVPSDGEESIDEGGGILQVGERLKRSLEEKNINAIWSDNTHVPHDAGAYSRSRRTVENMLQKNPDALIDVHRDAAPREEYDVDLGFQDAVQILLVVGQQQPNFEENKNFAESLKAVGDEMYPGLIKGVLFADGSYNQGLHPRNLLIEVGGHENRREDAESSVSLFGSILNARLYNGQDGIGAAVEGGEGGIFGRVVRGILWLLGAIVLGLGVFFAINYKNLHEAKSRLKFFFTREFSSLKGLGKRLKRK